MPTTKGQENDWAEKLIALTHALEEQLEADIYVYAGEIRRDDADRVIDMLLEATARRDNAYLLLTTFGGSPDGAYRIARAFQQLYKELTVHVHTDCKSAGTLMTLAAHKLVMSPFAELGPLDIQLIKPDELGERSSGLAITQALNNLSAQAFDTFEQHFLSLRQRSGNWISTKLAAEIASNMAIGLFSNVYEQIDPMRVGEIDRSLRIAVEYGERLSTGNVKRDAVYKLVAGYPSHEFVIDSKEACELFENCVSPSEPEAMLAEHLQAIVRGGHRGGGKPFIYSLSEHAREQQAQANKTEEANDVSPSSSGTTAPEQEDGGVSAEDEPGNSEQPSRRKRQQRAQRQR